MNALERAKAVVNTTEPYVHYGGPLTINTWVTEHLAKLVAAAIRAAEAEAVERCAKIAETVVLPGCGCEECRTNARGAHIGFDAPEVIAAAIRALTPAKEGT